MCRGGAALAQDVLVSARKVRYMVSLALLVLRPTAGSLLAGHGAQKLFGWFGGNGLEGTAKWLESMTLKPGKPWAVAVGVVMSTRQEQAQPQPQPQPQDTGLHARHEEAPAI
jgi:hypothetical protein